jgi:hypothetical protein
VSRSLRRPWARRLPRRRRIAGIDARTIAIGFTLGRAAIGAALVVTPSKASGGWIGPEADLPTSQVLARALGIRDLAIAVGTLAALRDGGDATPWLVAGIACDAVDLGATVAAGNALPPAGRAGVAALAGAAVVTGVAVLRALRD